MHRLRVLMVTTLSVMLLSTQAGCPEMRAATVACASVEGRALAEALGEELALLWGQDRAVWERRAREIAQQRGSDFLRCIADALRGPSLAHDGHEVALRDLAISL